MRHLAPLLLLALSLPFAAPAAERPKPATLLVDVASGRVLAERIRNLLAEAGTSCDALSQERVAQEIAIMADRLDVSEELSRLDAHLGELSALLARGGEMGKRLDFLIQEIFREIKETLQVPFVPDLFRALAARPDQLEAIWAQIKGLFGSGSLDVKTKALSALAVAAAQRSPYFVAIHSMLLKRLGATDEEIAELLEVAALSTALNTLVSGLALEPEL